MHSRSDMHPDPGLLVDPLIEASLASSSHKYMWDNPTNVNTLYNSELPYSPC